MTHIVDDAPATLRVDRGDDVPDIDVRELPGVVEEGPLYVGLQEYKHSNVGTPFRAICDSSTAPVPKARYRHSAPTPLYVPG